MVTINRAELITNRLKEYLESFSNKKNYEEIYNFINKVPELSNEFNCRADYFELKSEIKEITGNLIEIIQEIYKSLDTKKLLEIEDKYKQEFSNILNIKSLGIFNENIKQPNNFNDFISLINDKNNYPDIKNENDCFKYGKAFYFICFTACLIDKTGNHKEYDGNDQFIGYVNWDNVDISTLFTDFRLVADRLSEHKENCDKLKELAYKKPKDLDVISFYNFKKYCESIKVFYKSQNTNYDCLEINDINEITENVLKRLITFLEDNYLINNLYTTKELQQTEGNEDKQEIPTENINISLYMRKLNYIQENKSNQWGLSGELEDTIDDIYEFIINHPDLSEEFYKKLDENTNNPDVNKEFKDFYRYCEYIKNNKHNYHGGGFGAAPVIQAIKCAERDIIFRYYEIKSTSIFVLEQLKQFVNDAYPDSKTVTTNIINCNTQDEQGIDVSVLSPRQKQVYELLCKGYSDCEIASELKIKTTTVNSHNKEIFRRLDINDRRELIIKST